MLSFSQGPRLRIFTCLPALCVVTSRVYLLCFVCSASALHVRHLVFLLLGATATYSLLLRQETTDPPPSLTTTSFLGGNPENLHEMAHNHLVDSLYREFESAKQREAELQAQVAKYKEQLKQSTTSSNSTPKDTPSGIPDGRPSSSTKQPQKDDNNSTLYDSGIQIQTLKQQLFVSEQNTIQFKNNVAQREHELGSQLQASWQQNAALHGNVNYLITELQKANAFNHDLHMQLQTSHSEAEQKKRTPLNIANTNKAAGKQPVPIAPRPPPAPLNDTATLLAHTQTTIRSLRTEIRTLKTSRTELQDRLLHLSKVGAPNDTASEFLRASGFPADVLQQWSEVLLGRDREIAWLKVEVEREREMR